MSTMMTLLNVKPNKLLIFMPLLAFLFIQVFKLASLTHSQYIHWTLFHRHPKNLTPCQKFDGVPRLRILVTYFKTLDYSLYSLCSQQQMISLESINC